MIQSFSLLLLSFYFWSTQDIYSYLSFSKIVLVSVQDDGGRKVRPALPSLRRIGGFRIRPRFRGSYALAGFIGRGRPRWVKQQQRPRRRGPSTVKVKIPLIRIPKGIYLTVAFFMCCCNGQD